ncbi:MAG: TolC family protein [Verrucomicrobia bacterium]|nr:TolC family protein [Verrucomicrobiota bacterium]
MQRTFLVLVLSLLSSPVFAGEPALYAGEPGQPVRTLALGQCVQMALERNLDVQIRRYDPEVARYNVSISYAVYEPTLGLQLTRTGEQQPGGFDDQNRPFSGSSSDTDSFGGSIVGRLPWGMNYELGGGFNNTYGDRPEFATRTNEFGQIELVQVRAPFENSGGRVGALTLRQPVLRNAWMDQPRYSIALSKANLQMSELALRQQMMMTVTSVENAYYNLIYAAESVTVQQKALELAERLLAENKKRVEVGALAPLDEKQAEAEVASRKADLLTAQRAYLNQQNVLKNLVTDDYAAWHGVTIEPAAKLDATLFIPNLTDSWTKGLTLRPDIEQFRVELERQDITIRYQQNQLYPQLDLVGTYGYQAGGVSEFNEAFGQIYERENPFYSIGAQFSIPLGGNRTTRGNLKAARATKAQSVLELKKLEQSVMVEIDNAVGQVRTSFQKVEATRQARVYAMAALDAEQKKLENGKSTSFQVLQLQRDLVSAASAEIRALADYNIARSQLALAEGSTLERVGVDLQIR